MPGAILTVASTVLCAHGGQATPTVPSPRVQVAGQPVTTLGAPYTVAGCSFPPNAGGPCVTGTWIVGAVRVTAGGQPVLLQTGSATCVPTGTPLMPTVVQPRVTAT
jgi:hypothetical protein